MIPKIPGILTCMAAIGLCIFAGTIESDGAARAVAVVGAVVGVLGFVLIVFERPRGRKMDSK
jgi:hypothetical protein